VGTLALTRGQALPWQVVGYVERCEVPDGSDSEQSFWREYLLYNRMEGFAFLVDAEDGWSWTAPITGVPQKAGSSVTHEGVTYRKLYDYNGQITYVLGEFYWQLTRNQKTFNSDYVGTGSNSRKRLNREMTGSGDTQEIVWSAGETLNADDVVKAFRLAPEQRAALQRDASPSSTSASMVVKIFVVLAIIIVILLMARCSRNDREECESARQLYGDTSTEYQSCLSSSSHRTGGGSYGGFSSGGGHK
jgi:hypothetical protein